MPAKQVIFFSHIHEEKELAILLSETFKKAFLGMVTIFVSSDEESISLGDEWLESLFANLQSGVAAFILCSSESVTRPWINFEAGAAWIRKRADREENIQVVPLCHTDMTPGGLPLPLKLLNGVRVSDESALKRLVRLIAAKMQADEPPVDYTGLLGKIADFERRYGHIARIAHAVRSLCLLDPKCFRLIFSHPATTRTATGPVERADFDKMKPHLRMLQEEGLVIYRIGDSGLGFGVDGKEAIPGVYMQMVVTVQPTYDAIAGDVMRKVGPAA